MTVVMIDVMMTIVAVMVIMTGVKVIVTAVMRVIVHPYGCDGERSYILMDVMVSKRSVIMIMIM